MSVSGGARKTTFKNQPISRRKNVVEQSRGKQVEFSSRIKALPSLT
jgi:hypothetical protein